jgi:hypothetical protein
MATAAYVRSCKTTLFFLGFSHYFSFFMKLKPSNIYIFTFSCSLLATVNTDIHTEATMKGEGKLVGSS